MLILGQETIGADEPAIIQAIVDDTIAGQRAKFKAGTLARRDLHAKSHGTVAATFRILPNLAQPYKVGLFRDPKAYTAKVRMSNGTPGTKPADAFPNVRGIAIKLSQVPGAKLLPGDETSLDFDLLMANHPTFFIGSLDDFRPLNKLVGSGNIAGAFRQYPHQAFMALRSMLKLVKNPLQIAYYSQVPYKFGDGRAVKYALIPFKTAPLLSFPNIFDADYLLHSVQSLLTQEDVRFAFCAQFQQNAEREPIEDPSVTWRGPLVPLAELTIAKTAGPVLESTGEALSFNPWRVLAEHRPLGWASRVRRAVYAADFQWRTEMNARS
jgi:Catalase